MAWVEPMGSHVALPPAVANEESELAEVLAVEGVRLQEGQSRQVSFHATSGEMHLLAIRKLSRSDPRQVPLSQTVASWGLSPAMFSGLLRTMRAEPHGSFVVQSGFPVVTQWEVDF